MRGCIFLVIKEKMAVWLICPVSGTYSSVDISNSWIKSTWEICKPAFGRSVSRKNKYHVLCCLISLYSLMVSMKKQSISRLHNYCSSRTSYVFCNICFFNVLDLLSCCFTENISFWYFPFCCFILIFSAFFIVCNVIGWSFLTAMEWFVMTNLILVHHGNCFERTHRWMTILFWPHFLHKWKIQYPHGLKSNTVAELMYLYVSHWSEIKWLVVCYYSGFEQSRSDSQINLSTNHWFEEITVASHKFLLEEKSNETTGMM